MTTTAALPRPSASVLPERFAVEVTDTEIKWGRPCTADMCPIALAVTRWLRERGIHFVALSVTDHNVEINLDWHTPALRWWHDARSLVAAVDRGEPVEPRTVVLARLPR